MSWHRRTRLLTTMSILCLSSCGAAAASPTAAVAATLVPTGAGLLGRSGLSATVYASGLKTVSAFALDAEGRLWVATADYTDRGNDGLYVVSGAGAAPREVVSGLHTPLGLLWYGGSLFVASHARVDACFDGVGFAMRRTILTLASNVGENNTLVLAPDGRMLMGISAPCDHCVPSNSDSAAIISFLPDGSDMQVYASRIRAPVGLAFEPGTDQLLVTMNQRDDLGTRTPGDWLALVKQGESWGFPAGSVLTPNFHGAQR